MSLERKPDRRIKFSVDAALLRELGERLVGRPYIALAELVKNSYDADARAVVIRLADDFVSIRDNGHGMTQSEFQNFWMRVGTPHKQSQRVSRDLGRPLTGSKGIGRLAVQFLASKIRLVSVSKDDPSRQIVASIDWEQARHQEDLQQVSAAIWLEDRSEQFPEGAAHGTVIRLEGLRQHWSEKDAGELAKELWTLQPPYEKPEELEEDDPRRFAISFSTSSAGKREAFDEQMRAVLDIWNTRIKGSITSDGETGGGEVNISVQYRGEIDAVHHQYRVAECPIERAQFDIRVHKLTGRQRHGIKVGDAREFFERFGGINVYDAGFRLPYYGVEHDWLGTERDHAARKSRSKLLPDDLQVQGGLTFLPALKRTYGVVEIDTNREIAYAKARADAMGDNAPKKRELNIEALTIQPSRDRLVENTAYNHLRRAVRIALDFYSMEEKKRKLKAGKPKKKTVPTARKLHEVRDVIAKHAADIPDDVLETLNREIDETIQSADAERASQESHLILLGALATAGMGALAFEHEFGKELALLGKVTQTLAAGELGSTAQSDLAAQLHAWIRRAENLRAVFIPLLEQESREEVHRFRARATLRRIRDGLLPLTQMARVHLAPDIDDDIFLPAASFAAWSSIVQNVLVNAVNATLDQPKRLVIIDVRMIDGLGELRIEDTGTGVDLRSQAELFEPFHRRLEISEDRRQLGLGGTGLGLTIVRMIAEQIDCEVGFVEPGEGYSTAFSLRWREL